MLDIYVYRILREWKIEIKIGGYCVVVEQLLDDEICRCGKLTRVLRDGVAVRYVECVIS